MFKNQYCSDHKKIFNLNDMIYFSSNPKCLDLAEKIKKVCQDIDNFSSIHHSTNKHQFLIRKADDFCSVYATRGPIVTLKSL